MDINYVREDIENLFQGGGIYSYSNLQNIAADCPPDAAGCVPLADANPGRHYTSFNQAFDLRPGTPATLLFNTTDYNFYVQDTWRVNRAADPEPRPALRVPEAAPARAEQPAPTRSPSADRARTRTTSARASASPTTWAATTQTVLKGGFGIYYGRPATATSSARSPTTR